MKNLKSTTRSSFNRLQGSNKPSWETWQKLMTECKYPAAAWQRWLQGRNS